MAMNNNASFASKFRFFPAFFQKNSIFNRSLPPMMTSQMKFDDKFFGTVKLIFRISIFLQKFVWEDGKPNSSFQFAKTTSFTRYDPKKISSISHFYMEYSKAKTKCSKTNLRKNFNCTIKFPF